MEAYTKMEIQLVVNISGQSFDIIVVRRKEVPQQEMENLNVIVKIIQRNNKKEMTYFRETSHFYFIIIYV